MKKRILSCILFICSICVTAQNFSWAKSFGENGTTVVSSAMDASGNVYLMGNYSGTADFDPGPGVYTLSAVAYTDIFILKLDAAGNLLWAKTIGGGDYDIGKGMMLDNFGSMYITGMFSSTADFDPSPGTATITANFFFSDVFILKLDLSGSFMWVNSVGGVNNDIVIDINLTNLGYVYITGTYSGAVDFDPSPNGTYLLSQGGTYILKLDFSGNFVWAKSVTPAITVLALDSQDNIYLSGQLYNTTDLDPGPGTYTLAPSLGTDLYVSKWTGAGNFVWAKKIGGIDFDYVREIRVDASDDLYLTGSFGDVVDFDPGPGTYTLSSSVDVSPFICKLDSAGGFLWARHLNSLAMASSASFQDYRLDALVIDPQANVYLAGAFAGTLDFDPGPGTYTVTSKGTQDIFMLKLDAAGNFSKLYTAGGSTKDQGAAVCVNNAGEIFMSGTFGGTVDFDPVSGGYQLTSPNFRAFILKLNGPDVGLYENSLENPVTVYPNPARDLLTVDLQGAQQPEFRISNLLGQPVLTGRLNDRNQADVSQLPQGTYLLQVGNASNRPFKLIKQ